MAPPERRGVLAGVRPARVSAERPVADSSRKERSDRARRSVESPGKRGEQTSGPQRTVNAIASSHRQPKGVGEGRASQVTAKATDNILDRNGCWTSPGSQAAARWDRSTRNRRDPTGRPSRAKTGRRRPEGGNRAEAGRESERLVVPGKACQKTRWREGALLGSGWTGGKCEGLPETANTPPEKVRQLPRKL